MAIVKSGQAGKRRILGLFGALTTLVCVIGLFVLRPHALASAGQVSESRPATVTLIDGANDPSVIPDSVAFSMIFHILADHDKYPQRARSYMRFIGIGSGTHDSHHLTAASALDATSAADIKALLGIADEFEREAALFEVQASALYHANRNDMTAEVRGQLKDLYEQKLNIAQRLVDQLSARLSSDSHAKLRTFVDTHVKSRIKMVAN